ncbi:related to SERINE-TYPE CARBOXYPEPTIDASE F PRECURSOR [Rhynchosporium graminicola]|uniref:Related to SERINE-TYPE CARBOXYPEPTIDASE F n=1 Tax=Rhynchosporium graminicola TaxID=2792576 RepID=A0A1E1LNQ0_9HELO|nr:related to SERINE-TYPE CARBOXYPEPTIDASE F PRECURSOR [Rhynchosporium commune]
MLYSNYLHVLAIVSLVGALQSPHQQAAKCLRKLVPPNPTKEAPRTPNGGLFLNTKSAKFAVKGSNLPEVDFNIGESYAGSLPIGPPYVANANNLWFWFFPSTNPAAKKEIVIWLAGGPGCSSLQGVLQEHGPFLWQSGTNEPVSNPFSWNKLTNVIYIDQPVGTGFSQGSILVNNETDVANHFMGFWKNFVDTFSIQGYKIFLTGESFAGQYIPYIAKSMLDTRDKTYFNVSVPAVPALEKYNNVIGLDSSTVANVKALADACGYTSYHAEHTSTFPPSGPIPDPPSSGTDCITWNYIVGAAFAANPCFNVYHLTDSCPALWTELGVPTVPFAPSTPSTYFNRADVQRAIHAPRTDFLVCDKKDNVFPTGEDLSPPSGLGPLSSVIERTKNVIIAHGLLDFLLFADGSLITIQNMTWDGLQGFRTPPSPTSNFFVPQSATAGSGLQGVTHTERGLTFVTVNLAGHYIAQHTPGVAYRQLEFLLGRISSLEQQGTFTTD